MCRSKDQEVMLWPPLLTWLRMSYGQTSVLSLCTVSGVMFYSSTPVEISLFLDTHTPQTSSSIWLSPQCLGLDLWTLPWSTGPGVDDKKNSTPRKHEKANVFLKARLVCVQWCMFNFLTTWAAFGCTQQKKKANKNPIKNRKVCLSVLMCITEILSKQHLFHNGLRVEYASIAEAEMVWWDAVDDRNLIS